MANQVWLHVGLPKTGTTYLQTILWDNRDALRDQGVLVPGRSARQHLWASAVVREDPNVHRRHPRAPLAWDELKERIEEWPDTAIVSHEFFAGASQAQAARVISDLDGAEVHVVVTARELVSLVTARWQEWIKNGETTPIDSYPTTEVVDPADEWGWGTLDVAGVLQRWGATLEPSRVHLITVPGPGEPQDLLWERFAGLVGIDPGGCATPGSRTNESLGVVAVELLRRINTDLRGFTSPFDRGVWVRGYLAQQTLGNGGERFWPASDRVAELRTRGAEAVARVRKQRYDVIGDLDDLLTPAELPARRHPESVTETEMLDVAVDAIRTMLVDVRELTAQASTPAQDRPGPSQERLAFLGGLVRRRPVRLLGGLVQRLRIRGAPG